MKMPSTGSLAALALLIACGGETSGSGSAVDGGGGRSGFGGGAGGAVSGGAGPSGGAAPGGSGGVATGGAGGVAPAGTCELEPDPGACDAYIPSYYHDAATGVCTPFIYGGCGGNENRFTTVPACQDACGGVLPDLDECTSPLDCAIASPACCGACEPVVMEALVAVNGAELERYRQLRGCGDVLCEACLEPPIPERTRPYFVATCEGARCVPVDLRSTAAARCQTDADCSLRVGTGCCEGCDPSEVVALSDVGALIDLVCGGERPPCPACDPMLPPNLVAACDAGTCRVAETGPGP